MDLNAVLVAARKIAYQHYLPGEVIDRERGILALLRQSHHNPAVLHYLKGQARHQKSMGHLEQGVGRLYDFYDSPLPPTSVPWAQRWWAATLRINWGYMFRTMQGRKSLEIEDGVLERVREGLAWIQPSRLIISPQSFSVGEPLDKILKHFSCLLRALPSCTDHVEIPSTYFDLVSSLPPTVSCLTVNVNLERWTETERSGAEHPPLPSSVKRLYVRKYRGHNPFSNGEKTEVENLLYNSTAPLDVFGVYAADPVRFALRAPIDMRLYGPQRRVPSIRRGHITMDEIGFTFSEHREGAHHGARSYRLIPPWPNRGPLSDQRRLRAVKLINNLGVYGTHIAFKPVVELWMKNRTIYDLRYMLEVRGRVPCHNRRRAPLIRQILDTVPWSEDDLGEWMRPLEDMMWEGGFAMPGTLACAKDIQKHVAENKDM